MCCSIGRAVGTVRPRSKRRKPIVPRTLFKRPSVRALTLAFGMLTLSGCAWMTDSAATEPLPGASTFCRVARPITWSVSDTDQTIREVKEHNATGVRLCGWSA